MRELMCMMRACDRDEGVHERDSVCVCECVCVWCECESKSVTVCVGIC